MNDKLNAMWTAEDAAAAAVQGWQIEESEQGVNSITFHGYRFHDESEEYCDSIAKYRAQAYVQGLADAGDDVGTKALAAVDAHNAMNKVKDLTPGQLALLKELL